ncbi:uncharacterized protein B0H64DRAFT_372122 [Chaetomium fimeti]|uniref:Uncharacterized protein n=1 Tax=Chaetomium fimeti TaxID=1854472 RepID=A0AAE0HHN1_9PEZI|nr:hypothetical protein B0H64DRAFT_372122 [Chaetomium fimeti]
MGRLPGGTYGYRLTTARGNLHTCQTSGHLHPWAPATPSTPPLGRIKEPTPSPGRDNSGIGRHLVVTGPRVRNAKRGGSRANGAFDSGGKNECCCSSTDLVVGILPIGGLASHLPGHSGSQISGINLITYYTAVIYRGLAMSDFMSRLLAALNGTEYFMASWPAVFLVGMITPIAFNNIGYQTYVIFAVINASMAPCTYFFYPETAYRSLEEMDNIFHKVDDGWKGVFTVVHQTKAEPRWYGRNGAPLVDYQQTDEHRRHVGEAGVVAPEKTSGEGDGSGSGSGSGGGGATKHEFKAE